MAVPNKRGPLFLVMCVLTFCAMGLSARADEIRLKDGKKLYGVIVAYEDSMFKVKTDFGFVLVEKDKIESIIPSTPGTKSEPALPTKKDAAQHPVKPADNPQPKAEPAVATSTDATTAATNASAKAVSPGTAGKADKTAPKMTNAAAKPEVATNTAAANGTVPANGLPASTTPPAAPKEPEVPANREEIQGNLYTNYTQGFRMYKAPSWSLIEEARGALPNAIVAMGTSNESTLLVVGEEKTKEPLDVAATAVEKRLQDVYVNYRRVSQRKTTAGGLPAVEYQYRGKADDHDWSGKLVVISRGKDMLTVLAMTYADSDLIQIQENVISRAIASLDFNVH
jgi:hypothetical protein